MKDNPSKTSVKVDDTMVSIHAAVTWRAVRSKRSPVWVGTCQDLGLVAEAESLDELYSSVMETMDLLFHDLVKEGDLDEFLSEKDWQYSGNPNVHEPRFFIPWQIMVAAGRNDSLLAAA